MTPTAMVMMKMLKGTANISHPQAMSKEPCSKQHLRKSMFDFKPARGKSGDGGGVIGRVVVGHITHAAINTGQNQQTMPVVATNRAVMGCGRNSKGACS